MYECFVVAICQLRGAAWIRLKYQSSLWSAASLNAGWQVSWGDPALSKADSFQILVYFDVCTTLFQHRTQNYGFLLSELFTFIKTDGTNLRNLSKLIGIDKLILLYWRGVNCCPMHCDLFKICCAPPNLGITRKWICRLNFAERPIFQAWGSLTSLNKC